MKPQLHLSVSYQLIEVLAQVRNIFKDGFVRTIPQWGFWTSTYLEGEQESAWTKFVTSQDGYSPVGDYSWWILEVDPTANIYHITDDESYRSLFKEYGIWIAKKRTLDFERMATVYDGLHLSEEGMKANKRMTMIDEWSCESTVWFHWKFQGMTLLRQKATVTESDKRFAKMYRLAKERERQG